LVVGLAAGVVCWASYHIAPASTSDFDIIIVAGQALLRGEDPYALVPAASPVGDPLFYPLPTVLLVLPLTQIPLELARALWAALSAGLLTLAAVRYGRGLAVALVSAPFLNAIVLGQWSPLLTAAAVLPFLGPFLVMKPSIGTAIWAAYPSRLALVGGASILGASVAVMPDWPAAWLAGLEKGYHTAPIAMPGGFVLLAALWRWRTPEGRLLAGLACVPQIPGLYELVPLFLIPRERREAYLLAILSYVAAFAGMHLFPRVDGNPLVIELHQRWPLILILVYLPALALVLRPTRQSLPAPARAHVATP
jgi:hypothetical protein